MSNDTTTPLEGEQQAAPSAPQSNDNLKLFLYGILGCLVIAIVVALGIGVYRAYAKTAADPYTMFVAKVLHLPAVKVNGDTSLYTDYISDLHAITVMRAYDKANNGPGASLSDQDMSDQVLVRQVNNILVAQAAKQLGVTISDSDVQTVVQQDLLSKFQSPADANKALMDRYGWTLAQYEDKVVKPYALENKLSDKVQADPAARAVIEAKAQSVLDQIKAGADFATMAKKYGQDGTAASGGDLGWFGRGDMVPEFENAVFALKKGELSPTLVQSQFGYHIVKLNNTKTEQVKDPTTGKMVAKEMVDASHILFLYPSVDDYLNNLLKVAAIHLYVNVHNPFPQLIASTASSTASQQ